MCRVEVVVPASYEHGDQVKCGSCGSLHRVVRGERTRLVLADMGALRESVRAAEKHVHQIEDDLRSARASVGIGVNGLGVGVAYIVWQIGLQDAPWSTALLWKAALSSLLAAVALEAANYLFLAKRQHLTRLSKEIESARRELLELRQRLREAGRV
jgi:hypothetical protein